MSAKIFCFITSILLLTYTFLRACNLSFTHDESYTFLYCSQDSFMQIISNRTTEISANNHILNTLFMKLFYQFSNDEFTLRLHSIIAHIIYLIFTFLILKIFKSNFILIIGFIILNINPYFLDFFSLARGYALAIACMMASIWFFITYIKTERNNHLISCLIAASIALLANFALLNFFAAIVFIHQVFLYRKYKNLKTSFSKSKPILINILLLAIICYEPLRKLIKYERFDFGGTKGIWNDTVYSLIDSFLYRQYYHPAVFLILKGLVLFTVVSFLIIVIYSFLKGKTDENISAGAVFFSILFLILFLNILQHYLLGSPYVVERFALFLVPLFALCLVCLLNFLTGAERKVLRMTGYIFSFSFAAFLLLHFNNCSNLKYTINWDYDADTKNMLADLEKEKENSGKQNVKLGITWLYEPTINFYRQTRKMDWLEKVDRKGIKGEYDYYYVARSDNDVMPDNKILLKQYPVSGSSLLK